MIDVILQKYSKLLSDSEGDEFMEFANKIIEILNEEGIYIEYKGEDLDLREYIIDSLQYISFIVDIENLFGIEIPDEYLIYDSIASLHSFSNVVKMCKEG